MNKAAYATLEKIFYDRHQIKTSISQLIWEKNVYRPLKSEDIFSDQISTLEYYAHQKIASDNKVKELLSETENEITNGELSPSEIELTRVMRRTYVHESCVPQDLVKKLSKSKTYCLEKWAQARQENDYTIVSSTLNEVVELTKDIASIKSAEMGLLPYETQLNKFDPYISEREISKVFNKLTDDLPGILSIAIDKFNGTKYVPPTHYTISREKMSTFLKLIATELGFDFSKGRIDFTDEHPYFSGTQSDARILTRFDSGDICRSLLTSMHELGHAIFEIKAGHTFFPLFESVGMTIHEANALFFEKMMGRSSGFAAYIVPKIRNYFGLDGEGWTIENIYKHFNSVKRSYLRVKSDEISYMLHVILRFNLERDMINGKLSAKDLPDAWNDFSMQYFGIRPSDNLKEGCLQDIHWYAGDFGYFPSYAMGAVTAQKMFKSMSKEIPQISTSWTSGCFGETQDWLVKNVYKPFKTMNSTKTKLLTTNSMQDVESYTEYLHQKYNIGC